MNTDPRFFAILIPVLFASCSRKQPVAYYKGIVDTARVDATLKHLPEKMRSGAIIIGTPTGMMASSEGLVHTDYVINQVLAGHDFLQSYTWRDGLLGGPEYVSIQYAESWLKTKPLDVPGGVSLLFLDASGESETLVLHDTEHPNDGITFATKEAVQQTRKMLQER